MEVCQLLKKSYHPVIRFMFIDEFYRLGANKTDDLHSFTVVLYTYRCIWFTMCAVLRSPFKLDHTFVFTTKETVSSTVSI